MLYVQILALEGVSIPVPGGVTIPARDVETTALGTV